MEHDAVITKMPRYKTALFGEFYYVWDRMMCSLVMKDKAYLRDKNQVVVESTVNKLNSENPNWAQDLKNIR